MVAKLLIFAAVAPLSSSFSVTKPSSTADDLAAGGATLMPVAVAQCGDDESVATWQKRGDTATNCLKEWTKRRPGSTIQVDTGDGICITDGETAGSSPVDSRSSVLTLVHKSAKEICLSEDTTAKMDVSHDVEFTSVPVDGAMKQRGDERTFVTVWPGEGTCTASSKCSVVMSLHGLGEHGKPGDEAAHKLLSKTGLLRMAMKDGACYGTLKSVMLFPQLLEEESWVLNGPEVLESLVMPQLNNLLDGNDEILDRSRVAVVGYSEGALGALHAAMRYPDVFTLGVAASTSLKSWDHMKSALKTAKPSSGEHKLRLFVMSLGERDASGDQADNLKEFVKAWDGASLDKKAALHVRLYAGISHNHWEKFFNNWRGFHDTIWRGNFDLLK